MAGAVDIPIMVQDAPASGVTLSVPFLAFMAMEFLTVRWFEIETPMAAAKLRALIQAGGEAILGPFDGEESIKLAAALDARIPPLIDVENRQSGLRATKAAMMEGGVIKSDYVRHSLEPLHDATREGRLRLARETRPLALSWGH